MKRIELHARRSGDWFSGEMKFYLCGDDLLDWFDIPVGTMTIWLCIDAKKHDDSYRVYSIDRNDEGSAVTDAGEVELSYDLSCELDWFLCHHGRAYVSLEVPA